MRDGQERFETFREPAETGGRGLVQLVLVDEGIAATVTVTVTVTRLGQEIRRQPNLQSRRERVEGTLGKENDACSA